LTVDGAARPISSSPGRRLHPSGLDPGLSVDSSAHFDGCYQYAASLLRAAMVGENRLSIAHRTVHPHPSAVFHRRSIELFHLLCWHASHGPPRTTNDMHTPHLPVPSISGLP